MHASWYTHGPTPGSLRLSRDATWWPSVERMAKDRTRELRRAEKVLGRPKTVGDWLLSGDKARDRADAERQIAGLNQQDQVIAVLNRIADQLQWITEEMERNRKPSPPQQTFGTPQG